MRITNNYGLPSPLVKAIENDGYSKGDADASVTELIGPARIASLKVRHGDDLTGDASNMIYSLLGKIGHGILESAADSGIVERRFFIERDGWKISGQADLIPGEKRLIDYKLTSVWAIANGVKPEWVEQTNIYRLMAHEHGIDIEHMDIIAILRDWSKMKARFENDYPNRQAIAMKIPVWPFERTEAFISERIAAHKAARSGKLPECTEDERWARPAKYAVIKKGAKRASRLYEDKDEAYAHADTDPAFRVEFRAGESIRCQEYCPVADFCSQWKGMNDVAGSE